MKKQYTSPDMTFLIWGNKDDVCVSPKTVFLGEGSPTAPTVNTSSSEGGMQ